MNKLVESPNCDSKQVSTGLYLSRKIKSSFCTSSLDILFSHFLPMKFISHSWLSFSGLGLTATIETAVRSESLLSEKEGSTNATR